MNLTFQVVKCSVLWAEVFHDAIFNCKKLVPSNYRVRENDLHLKLLPRRRYCRWAGGRYVFEQQKP